MATVKPSARLEARLPKGQPLAVRAVFVGERIHTKGLGDTAQPFEAVVLPAGAAGLALLFRYGAVVFFHTSESEQKTFLQTSSAARTARASPRRGWHSPTARSHDCCWWPRCWRAASALPTTRAR
jgi:hypothetical protein